MPQFLTVSPTHIPGKKEYAWQKFLRGGYAAIGWLYDVDLTGKTIETVTDLIRSREYENEGSAIQSFERFLALRPGDYLAVNNVNHGLFGVGEVRSTYKYEKGKHDSGASEPEHLYSHYVDVNWVVTSYTSRRALLAEGETTWKPYGATGALLDSLPSYVARLLVKPPEGVTAPATHLRPDWLETVLQSIEILKRDTQHQERAHESLVEDFLYALGYKKHENILYRQGRLDITLRVNGSSVALLEVKRAWDLNIHTGLGAVRQAYNYALTHGIRHVVVTNGDTYLIFDRLKGLTYEANQVAQFQLSSLEEDDLQAIDALRPENLPNPKLEALFRNLAECFQSR